MSANLTESEVYVYTPRKSLKESAFFQQWPDFALAFLVLVAAFGLRLYNLNRTSLWWDEIYPIKAVQSLDFIQSVTFFHDYDLHPPLFKGLLRLWLNIAGFGEFGVRLFSVLVATANLALLYLLGRRWFSHQIALTGLLLMVVSPLHLYWSQSIRPYAFLTLLVTISMALALFTSEQPRQNWRWLLYGLSALVMIYTHYLGFYVLFCQVVFLGIVLFKNWSALIRLGLTLALTGLAFLPWLDHFLVHNKLSNEYFSFLEDNRSTTQLLQALETFLIWSMPGSLAYLAGAVFFSLYLIGLIWLGRNRRTMAIFLFCWGLLPLLVAWGSGLVRSNFTIHYHYFAFCVPGLLLTIAVGIWSLKSFQRLVPYLALGLALVLSVGAIVNYSRNFVQQDWRGLVGEVVANHKPDDVIFLANPEELTLPAFNFYYVDQLKAPGNLKRASVLGAVGPYPPQVKQIFDGKNTKRVWVVRWLVGDEVGLQKLVLDSIPANYIITYYKEFPSSNQGTLSLALYSLP